MYALCTKRQQSAPRATSVVVQALRLVLATVIAAAILTTAAPVAFVDSPFNFKEL
jgi:hypothetical protein